MAHFAELDSSNVVLRVIVIDNGEVDANGGDESTQAEEYVKNLVPLSENGVVWKQTSYNKNFRKQYAGKGFTYDSVKDVFIQEKPFSAWTLNADNEWIAPYYPANDDYSHPISGEATPHYKEWSEANTRWEGKKIIATGGGTADDHLKVYYDNSDQTWKNI
tara:strand:- start:1 stop:483 length:483 start_codon:yes stop_codon:yes gene_type:complete